MSGDALEGIVILMLLLAFFYVPYKVMQIVFGSGKTQCIHKYIKDEHGVYHCVKCDFSA